MEQALTKRELLARFPEIAAFLGSTDLKSISPGRYALEHGVYVNVEEYETEAWESKQYESHKRYVDVQYIVSGGESILVSDMSALRTHIPYDAENDITFYERTDSGKTRELREGTALILYPSDAHMPGVSRKGAPEHVRKAVFKIPLAYFSKIRCVVFDVDGTLTDGKIYMGEEGELFKAFNVKDGYGIKILLPEAGITPAIITGRSSAIVSERCGEMGVSIVRQGVEDKVAALEDVLNKLKLKWENAAYMGDDLNDCPVMQKLKTAGGITACPVDAARQVLDTADFISPYKGGDGAARSFVDWLCVSR